MEIDATQPIDLAFDDTDDEYNAGGRKKVSVLILKDDRELNDGEYTIYQGKNIIGRHEKADVHIPIKSLSKKHACIEVISGQHFIYDLGSKNKTKRGKIFLQPDVRYELIDGMQVTFADVTCEYHYFCDAENGNEDDACSETGSESVLENNVGIDISYNNEHCPAYSTSDTYLLAQATQAYTQPFEDNEKVDEPKLDLNERNQNENQSNAINENNLDMNVIGVCSGSVTDAGNCNDSKRDKENCSINEDEHLSTVDHGKATLLIQESTDDDENEDENDSQGSINRPNESENDSNEGNVLSHMMIATQAYGIAENYDEDTDLDDYDVEDHSLIIPEIIASKKDKPKTDNHQEKDDVIVESSQEVFCCVAESPVLHRLNDLYCERKSRLANDIDGLTFKRADKSTTKVDETILDDTLPYTDNDDYECQLKFCDKSTLEDRMKISIIEQQDAKDSFASTADGHEQERENEEKKEICLAEDINCLDVCSVDGNDASIRSSTDAQIRKERRVNEEDYDIKDYNDGDQVCNNNNGEEEFHSSVLTNATSAELRSKKEKRQPKDAKKAGNINGIAFGKQQLPLPADRRYSKRLVKELAAEENCKRTMLANYKNALQNDSSYTDKDYEYLESLREKQKPRTKRKTQKNDNKSFEVLNKKVKLSHERASHDEYLSCQKKVVSKRTRKKSSCEEERTPCSTTDIDTRLEIENESICSHTQFSPDTSLRLRLREHHDHPKVLFTGLTDKCAEKWVEALGGDLCNSVYDATHLITDKVRRTVKFLCCLSRGIQIVDRKWLQSCWSSKSFLPSDNYVVKDEQAEKCYDFELKRSLVKAGAKKLLQGFSVHATKNIKPDPKQMRDIIQCAGGKFLSRLPKKINDQTLILTCDEDRSDLMALVEPNTSIFSTELILTGILQQELHLETFKLDWSFSSGKSNHSKHVNQNTPSKNSTMAKSKRRR